MSYERNKSGRFFKTAFGVSSGKFRIDFLKKKYVFYHFITLRRELVYFQQNTFGLATKTAIYVHEGKFWKKRVSREQTIFLVSSSDFQQKFLEFPQKYFRMVVKIEIYVPKGTFQKNLLIRKNQFFFKFELSEWNFGLLDRRFWRGCHKCNQFVWKNDLLHCTLFSKKNTIYTNSFELSAERFQPTIKKFLVVLSKLNSECPEEHFEEKLFSGKTFSFFSDYVHNTSGMFFETVF